MRDHFFKKNSLITSINTSAEPHEIYQLIQVLGKLIIKIMLLLLVLLMMMMMMIMITIMTTINYKFSRG